jgi:hypothetical protein
VKEVVMGLDRYQIGLRQQAQTGNEGAQQFETGRTVWGENYRPPLIGVVNVEGEQVEAIALTLGDKQGASDVLFCMDRSGIGRTVKAEHFRGTAIPMPNGQYLPISTLLDLGQLRARQQTGT